MHRVRIMAPMAGDHGFFHAGDIVTLPPEVARQIVINLCGVLVDRKDRDVPHASRPDPTLGETAEDHAERVRRVFAEHTDRLREVAEVARDEESVEPEPEAVEDLDEPTELVDPDEPTELVEVEPTELVEVAPREPETARAATGPAKKPRNRAKAAKPPEWSDEVPE